MALTPISGEITSQPLNDNFSSLQTEITEHKADTTTRAINVKYPPTPLVGCKVDGVTDDTSAFNIIYQHAYDNGLSVFIPGVMRITGSIGVSTTLTDNRSFPTISGNKAMAVTNNLSNKVQDGSIILYDAVGGSALQIKNLDLAKYFYGGLIKNIAIVKQNSDSSTDGSIGLDLQGCVDYRLQNVACIGFDIGFKNTFGWSWDTYGMICVRNNIGVMLEDNSNAVGFHGSQLHQNKINIKILSGTNILFNKATLEGGDSKAVVITKGLAGPTPNHIKFQNCYLEQNTGGFIVGKDENGVASSSPIRHVSFDHINASSMGAVVPFDLDNAVDINLENISWGDTSPLIASTDLTQRVSVDKMGGMYQTNIGRHSSKRRIAVANRVNLLPDGFLQFPDLTDFKRGGLVAEFDTTTFSGEKVVKITVPDGTASNVYTRKIVKINKDMAGKRLVFSGVGQKTDGITATFTAYTPALSSISGGSRELPITLDKATFFFTCPDEEYINLSIRVVNASGFVGYVYIKNMVLVEDGVGEIEPSPLDYISGLSGALNVTTTGTIIPFSGWKADMYEVMVTPRASLTAYVTKADNEFTITSSVNGAVAYLIIPKVGMMI